MKKNIFVIGLEPFNLRLLQKVHHAETYEFHGLLDYDSVTFDPDMDAETLLEHAFEQLDAFPGTVDAIVGYWDFPTVLMMPIIRKRYGLPGPSLESVLKCEHKYWARQKQAEVLPECVPSFALVDPFDEAAADQPPLPYPFWIKPVKAHSSLLGFRVNDIEDYRHALEANRKGIHIFAKSMTQIMGHAEIPDEFAGMDGWKCIAESIISAGRQCTLEGYVYQGTPEVYGTVDSVRGPNRSSFERYEYPSILPVTVRERMIEAAKRLVTHVGLDNTPFNMEFYWNSRTDHIWLLETNARISKSHSPMFEKVEGVPHKEVMVDVALGRKPEYPLGEGAYRHAAKFMLRHYDRGRDGLVTRAPGSEEVSEIERQFPGCEISPHVSEGMHLQDSHMRDSYSTELADIFVGAQSHHTLMHTYHEIVDALNIKISDLP
ncbi:ATP-grasp domain-containing protein [Henriciella aquimarina]|uniref:ATP-grasp domain-containing protein n=1 Tax=Henriciella aquimarina TaxID=545261 RepID=UPI000A04547B|nr:hypothetical protein [Henriciella aquimarina]